MIQMKNVSGDVFGGITAAVVALPLALAFGVQSGMGAIAGLYGAIALGIFAALFGGTNTQISGPTGPMAIVASAIIAGEIAIYGSLNAAMGTIVATFVLAGIFQIIMGISGVGKYVRYMPYSVVSGFMSGIGVIIIMLQIFPLFGLTSPKSIVDIILNAGEISSQLNGDAITLALSTIVIIYIFPQITRIVPSALIALISLTIVSNMLGLHVAIIGDIPNGLPDFHIDTLLNIDWSNPMAMVIPALTLAALGAIDSLLTSVVADNMTKTQHNSNKELIGQGIGNTMAGLIGGLPGAGATMRTVVNINAGGTTKLSGLIHGLILILILLGASAYASLIPIPVLAGILITVGIGIIDYKGIKHILHVPRSDAVVMLIVLLMTVFVDLLQAVAVGMVMASVLFMKQVSDRVEQRATSGSLDDFEHLNLLPDEKKISDALKQQIYIHHFDGPIFFGFTSHFKVMMQKLPNVQVVIFRMKRVPYIDQSGMYVIEDAVQQLHKKGIAVIICEIQQQSEDMLRNIKMIPGLIPESHVFSSFKETIEALEQDEIELTQHCDIKKPRLLWRY